MRELTVDQTKRETNYEITRRLKSLNTTRGKLLSFAKTCRTQIKRSQADLADVTRQLEQVEAELAAIDRDCPVVVSEHALLRYLARHKGIDLDKVAVEVSELPEDLVTRKGNTIVTILEG